MIAQVASASLVSENKVLCHPASVDSIPSSRGQGGPREHGEHQRAQARAGRDEREHALAIEIMTAAAGIDQRAPLRPSRGVAAAQAAVRARVAPMTEDRPLYRDIEAVAEIVTGGELVKAVEVAVGALG